MHACGQWGIVEEKLLEKADHPRRQFAGVGKGNRTLIGIQNLWQQGGFRNRFFAETNRRNQRLGQATNWVAIIDSALNDSLI